MKNKLLPLLVIVLALCFCALTACDKTSGGSDSNGGPTATYELEGSLPEAAVFGEELDLSSLFIVKRLGEETERIPVTKDMITSGGTASVGVSAVTFSYDGNTFTRVSPSYTKVTLYFTLMLLVKVLPS